MEVSSVKYLHAQDFGVDTKYKWWLHVFYWPSRVSFHPQSDLKSPQKMIETKFNLKIIEIFTLAAISGGECVDTNQKLLFMPKKTVTSIDLFFFLYEMKLVKHFICLYMHTKYVFNFFFLRYTLIIPTMYI